MTGTSQATPALLWARAGLLAVVVLTVSTVAHASADGRLPGPLTMAALLLVTTVLSGRFLTRQASARRLVALLVAGQTAVHGSLTVLAGHATPHEAPEVPHHTHQAGHHTHATPHHAPADPAESATGPVTPLSDLVDHLVAQSPAMLLAHLLAVVVLGMWLEVGERALWTFLTLSASGISGLVTQTVTAALRRCLPLSLTAVRRTPVLRALSRYAVPLLHLLHHVVAHRGPPALLAA